MVNALISSFFALGGDHDPDSSVQVLGIRTDGRTQQWVYKEVREVGSFDEVGGRGQLVASENLRRGVMRLIIIKEGRKETRKKEKNMRYVYHMEKAEIATSAFAMYHASKTRTTLYHSFKLKPTKRCDRRMLYQVKPAQLVNGVGFIPMRGSGRVFDPRLEQLMGNFPWNSHKKGEELGNVSTSENPYHSGGPFSHNHVQDVNSTLNMGTLNDVTNNRHFKKTRTGESNCKAKQEFSIQNETFLLCRDLKGIMVNLGLFSDIKPLISAVLGSGNVKKGLLLTPFHEGDELIWGIHDLLTAYAEAIGLHQIELAEARIDEKLQDNIQRLIQPSSKLFIDVVEFDIGEGSQWSVVIQAMATFELGLSTPVRSQYSQLQSDERHPRIRTLIGPYKLAVVEDMSLAHCFSQLHNILYQPHQILNYIQQFQNKLVSHLHQENISHGN
ncbi:hypothetical protein LXL04_009917 [Taraxacum kok-saghyz]